jgi:hypothetical protein
MAEFMVKAKVINGATTMINEVIDFVSQDLKSISGVLV